MSATNTTTNYSLPIFIGSDKPAWLVDFNGAMNAIDAQMKVNADAIATKSPILTFNDTTEIDFTRTGDVITANLASGVSDKVGRALVTPISAPASEELVSINTSGTQSAITLGTGLELSAGTLNAIDLNLTDIHNFASINDMRTHSGSYSSINYFDITVALNAEKNVGKVYGTIQIVASSFNYITLNTGIYLPNISEEFNIRPAGITTERTVASFSGGTIGGVGQSQLTIKQDGELCLYFPCGSTATTVIYLSSLYFFSDFGDTPMP